MNEEQDIIKSNAKSFFDLILYNKNICIIFLLWLLVLFENIYFYYNSIHSIYIVDMFHLSTNDIYISVSILAPAVIWLFSTNVNFWNFHTRKFVLLLFVYINTLFRLSTIIYNMFYILFMPFVLNLKPTKYLTTDLIVLLARLLVQLPSLMIFIYFSLSIKNFFNEYLRKDIAEFKLKHYTGTKINKYEYTLNVAKDMDTGKRLIVSQADRETHVSIAGTTGTGKTTAFNKAINNDLYHKVLNENAQKKALLKMLKAGKVKMLEPMEDRTFTVSNFEVTDKKYLKEYKKKVLKYYSAGITVVAPDNSLIKDVVKFCDEKGFDYKRVDPKREDNGELCKNFYGLNPLYMPDNLTDYEFETMVSKKANIVADVMKALNEMDGKGDPYFNAVNREVIITLVELLLRTHKDLKKRQATLIDLQALLNRFDEILPFYEYLQKKYPRNDQCAILKAGLQILLGGNREKMEDHSTGVKVLLNNFLNDINIRTVMSAENVIDFDQALRDGEIILVNFELGELGTINSPAFGLFFILMYIDAVLRRKGERGVYKVPNFFFVDEFPVVASPQFKVCFTLFRKFKASVHIALQTFSQFEETEFLKVMKGVVLTNCNTHIIFGKAGIEDMKIFSELDGEQSKEEVQIGVTQTSITTENPTYSMQKRATVKRDARTSGADIRYKDFLEGTMYHTVNGHTEHAKHVKMDFITPWEERLVKKFKVDWNKFYVPEAKKFNEIEEKLLAAGTEDIPQSVVLTEIPKKIINVVEEKVEDVEKIVSSVSEFDNVDDLVNEIVEADKKCKEKKEAKISEEVSEEAVSEEESFDF